MRSRARLLAALLPAALAACASTEPPPEVARDTAKPPGVPAKTAPDPGAKPSPVATPKAPAKTTAPAEPSSDIIVRATNRGWERGRIALVVDLILKSKSFDRGFESAIIFIPEMREGVTLALLEQAASLDGRSRERSLEALGSMARLRLVPDALRPRAVETVSARVRTESATGAWSAAVLALGSLAGVDAGREITDALGRAVEEDQGPVVRACAEVLADLEYRPAAGALVVASDRVRDRYAARTLIRTLGRIGGSEATERLKRALTSQDAGDREAAAAALGEAGGPLAAQALRTTIMKADESPSVRRAAIAALERMGGEEAEKALQGVLADLADHHEESWVVISRDVTETLERLKRK
jgi:hypothetical protein